METGHDSVEKPFTARFGLLERYKTVGFGRNYKWVGKFGENQLDVNLKEMY